MTTPNTTGASVEDMDAVRGIIGDWEYSGLTVEALARLIARAREESRREALEEAANIAFPRHATAIEGSSIEEVQYLLRSRIARGIRALLTPTPQGETKEKS